MRTIPSVIVLLLSAGCARDDTAFPSLAPRAVEGQGFAEPAMTPPPPVTTDPALDARLTGFRTRLDAVVAGFDADAARARRASAAVGARTVGGEAWIAAQTALASLDDWRAQADGLASEVDAVVRERAATVGTAYPPLDALRMRTEAEAARQGAVIATIGATLPTPR